MTYYAAMFPSFKQCAVATSSALNGPGFTLLDTQPSAYRLLLFAGRTETMYLYRFAGNDCPAGQ
jgi:hypothetical protein